MVPGVRISAAVWASDLHAKDTLSADANVNAVDNDVATKLRLVGGKIISGAARRPPCRRSAMSARASKPLSSSRSKRARDGGNGLIIRRISTLDWSVWKSPPQPDFRFGVKIVGSRAPI